jgi:GDPmannose 4,6-dehydratase
MKKIALISGISGMVGSHLADFLIENTDWEIHGVARWRSPLDNLEHLIPRLNARDRIFYHYADLNDYVSLDKVVSTVKPEYVFHLAAQSFPKFSFDAANITYETNILGTQNILEACRRHVPEAVIHVCSSSEVFGRVPRENLPINEDVRFHPASPYAISKAGTDLIGRFFAEAYGSKTIITRMFTHTGPRRGDVFAESSFAKQIAMIENGMIRPEIRVGNLDSLRTFADVRDAVRAYYLAVTVNPIPGEAFNIGGAYTCTIGEMLETLIGMANLSQRPVITVDSDRLRSLDADLQIPDTRKFENHTGWKPEISFEKTMFDLLNYWRQRVSKVPSLNR